MRVLFPFIGDTVGGSHISSYQLICALRELDVEPIILLHQREGKHASWLANLGETWEVEELPILLSSRRVDINARRLIRGLKPASRLLQKLEIDLVHGNDSRVNRAWATWCRWANIPMIWHQRSEYKKSIQIRLALPLASGVISISDYVASTAPSLKSPHITIYNPITKEQRDKKSSAIRLREELNLTQESKIVGCFANAQSWKRPDTFVEVAHRCQQENPNLKFVWFGNDYDGSLKKAVEQKFPSNFIHSQFRQDVLSAMAGCDVVLAPSQGEPFGRTLIEAMTLGVPVVATDSGGHKEIIQNGQNGVLFPVGNSESCTSCILQIIQDEGLRLGLIENGMNSIKQFEPKCHAEKVLRFYQSLLEKSD